MPILVFLGLSVLNLGPMYATCPQNSSISIELEMMVHVIDWTRENKMSVNLLKTAELVFRRPNISNDLLLSVMTNVRRVGAAKLLGVSLHLTQNFTRCGCDGM